MRSEAGGGRLENSMLGLVERAVEELAKKGLGIKGVGIRAKCNGGYLWKF